MHVAKPILGVTLIELVFSLGLLALLAGLAAPGFRTSLRVSALRSASFELLSGLQQTRANSILESRPGLFCPADAAGTCLPPGASATAWRAFLEEGPARRATGGQQLPPGIVVRATRSPIRFWPYSLAASNGTLTICDQQAIAPPRAIVISQNGRARLGEAAAGACAS